MVHSVQANERVNRWDDCNNNCISCCAAVCGGRRDRAAPHVDQREGADGGEKAIQSINLSCTEFALIDGGFIQEHFSGMHSVQLYSNQPSLMLSSTIFVEYGIGATTLTRLSSLPDSIDTFVGTIDMELLLLVLERKH